MYQRCERRVVKLDEANAAQSVAAGFWRSRPNPDHGRMPEWRSGLWPEQAGSLIGKAPALTPHLHSLKLCGLATASI
jgi:hypothetical protein